MMRSHGSGPASHHSPILIGALCLGILAATCALYARSLHVPFLLDDHHAILNNPAIQDVTSFLNLGFFSRPRALVDLTFALNWAWGQDQVLGYHLVNVGIHAVNGLLVFFLSLMVLDRSSRRTSRPITQSARLFFAAAAAAIFICHPIQTQAVTYVVQRYTSMSALFSLAAVIAFLKMRATPAEAPARGPSLAEYVPRVFWPTACLFFTYAAFLCKQNALALPFLFALMEGTLHTDTARYWRPKLIWAVPSAALVLAGIAWNLGLFHNPLSFGDLLDDVDQLSRETLRVSRTTYFLTQLRVLCIYAGLLVLPIRQCIDWKYPFVVGFFDGWTPLAAAILAGLLLVMWKNWRRRPLIALAVGWFFAAQIVESSFIPIRDALFEHRLYLPLVGYAWLAAYAFTSCYARRPLPAAASLALMVAALSTAVQLRHNKWQDPISLWQEAARVNRHNYRAYNNLGRHYLNRGQLDKAHATLLRALELNPWRAKVHTNLAEYYARTHNDFQALAHIRTAIQLTPTTASLYYNAGFLYHRLGRLSEAKDHYQCCLLLDPRHLKAAVNLAGILYADGQEDPAVSLLRRTIQEHPDAFNPHYYLAAILAQKGRTQEALPLLERALQLRPHDPNALRLKSRLLSLSATPTTPHPISPSGPAPP